MNTACVTSSQKSVETYPPRSLSQQSTQPDLPFSQVTTVGSLEIVRGDSLELCSVVKVTTAAQTIPAPARFEKATDAEGLADQILTCEIGISAVDQIPQYLEDRLVSIESILKTIITPRVVEVAEDIPTAVAPPVMLVDQDVPRTIEFKRTFDIGGAVIVRGSLLKRRRL